MYNVSIPVATTNRRYDRERIARELKAAGARRVFLCPPPVSADLQKEEAALSALGEEIRFFSSLGFETGVWFWAFRIDDAPDIPPIRGLNLAEEYLEKCPMDPAMRSAVARRVESVAKLHPDLIMFDDDLRFGFLPCGQGCLCGRHMRRIGELCGEEVKAEGFFERAFRGGPNKYRRAFLKANGEAIRAFATDMRKAVDRVCPDIRLGHCACLSNWDFDGDTNAFEVSRLLAGKNRPFLRLIGAPYWAAGRNWNTRLPDVIELERMEKSWCGDGEIEIFSECDCFPRPRWSVPASFVEIFDTALRFDGSLDGVLKYMVDYTASMDYEPGYLRVHNASRGIYEEIEHVYAGGTSVGIRVYEAPAKLPEADLSADIPHLEQMFFSRAARMLSQNAVPTVYGGTGGAGIAFGENARHLPESAFTCPLILDAPAARILGILDKGKTVDFDSKSVPEYSENCVLYFPDVDEYCSLPGKIDIQNIALPEGARVRAVYKTTAGEIPFIFTLGNQIILNCDCYEDHAEILWRNYLTVREILLLAKEAGAVLPLECYGHPDLYIQAKRDGEFLSVGLWNCSADAAENIELAVPGVRQIDKASLCEAKTGKNAVVIDRIAAFEYAFLRLRILNHCPNTSVKNH